MISLESITAFEILFVSGAQNSFTVLFLRRHRCIKKIKNKMTLISTLK